MSIKKTLAAGTALAFVAGSASALTFELTAAPIKLAEETDFTIATSGVGNLGAMTVETTTALPIGPGYKITINLTGDAVFQNLTAAAVSATNISNTIISTGGNDGEKTVTILFDVTGANVGTTNPLNIVLPVRVEGCASDVSANINLTNAADAPIEGGTASLDDGATPPVLTEALTCVDAFQVDIDPDANNTLLSLASGFKNFLVAKTDTAKVGVMGEVETTIDTTAVGPTLAGAIAATDIASLEYDVEFSNLDGVASVDHTTGGQFKTVAATKSGTTFTVKTGASQLATGTDTIELTLDGVDPAQPQVLTVTNTTVELPTGFVDDVATVTNNGVDDLQLEGANFGPFDWVGDTSTIATTVFRVTGLKTLPDAVVTLTNSSGSQDGTYTLDLSGKTLSGDAATGSSQLVLTNADIQAAVGAGFGIADVTITFFTSDTVDVDRLIATGGIVSAFGDTGNSAAGPVAD